MTDIQRELLAAFDAEHREHLSVVRAALGRSAAGGAIDLKDVFRRVHSLKGAARAVDLPAVEEIAHRLETFFAGALERERSLSGAERAAVEYALDTVEGLVEALNEGRPAPPIDLAAAGLDRLLGVAAGPGEPVAEEAAAVAAVEPQTEFVRVAAQNVEALDAALAVLAAEIQAEDSVLARLREIDKGLEVMKRSIQALRRPTAEAAAAGVRLKGLETDLGATTTALRSLVQDVRRRRFAVDQSVRRVGDAVRAVSLVPAETVFGSFGRIVRELARESGVSVAYVETGLDLMVDRRVLQDLKDPVLHALRNAIGHGAEPESQRLAAGKAAEMTIALTVAVRRGRLFVSVSDDGRGPDLSRIETTAREKGLLSDAIGPVPPDRLLSVVFEPGFSTAGSVDRLSGRGMGLSVVAEAARKGRGTARLGARRPAGTELSLEMPLGAMLQSVVVVEADGAFYGLPVHGVERLLRLPTGALQLHAGRPAIWIETGGRNVIVPVLALATLIGPTTMPLPVDAGFARLAVLKRGDRRLAVAVDAFQDARPMKIDSLSGFGGDPRLVAGAVLAGEMPAPVLDLDGLIDRWHDLEAGSAGRIAGIAEGRPAEEALRLTILVVDDSITMRTLEKSILEAQGYRVVLAVDGLDALAALRSGSALADLVVADVEMPRMDGFALLQAIRNDARFAALPVVLMTSRAAPEDVRRGLDLGANAYVTKQRFDQRELLAIIGQLIG